MLLFEEVEATLRHLVVLLQFVLDQTVVASLNLEAHLQLTILCDDLLDILV